MNGKIILHIGSGKTGTSSLQYLLANHPQVLEKHGYSYLHPMDFPNAFGRQLSHCRLAIALLENKANFLQAFKARLVETSRTTTPVISAESLFNFPEKHLLQTDSKKTTYEDKIKFIASLRDYLLPEFTETHIIIYLRRQDELIQAWANQISKRNPRIIATPARIAEGLGLSLDYQRSLDCWKTIFPQATLTVRVYEKGQVEDTTQDFLSILSITDRDAFTKQSPGKTNSRISREAMEYLNLMKRLKLPPRIMNRVSDIVCKDRHAKATHSLEEYSLLSYAEKIAIMDQYRESNAAVARQYFNSDTLFRMAPKDLPTEPPLTIPGAIRYSVRVIQQLLQNG